MKKSKGLSFMGMVLSLSLLCSVVLTAFYGLPVAAADSQNRHNVVVVMDASYSMEDSDADRLRMDAVEQFMGLLTEEGNVVGGIIFGGYAAESLPPVAIDSQEDKDAVNQFFYNSGFVSYTNIGAGLTAAEEMLAEGGDPSLPSVIILLSDGNTAMETDEALEEALNLKAEAIQTARDNGTEIYTVCLNVDGSADVTEMQQISSATGGVFQEVARPEDLKDVLSTFYTLIYGTSTIPLVEDVFPESGRIETPFQVPGIGVEEVNIVINGQTTSITPIRPDGTPCDTGLQVTSGRSFSLVKILDVEPGDWTLVTTGVPGDEIRVNMVYNTNLSVLTQADPAESQLPPDTQLTVKAQLASGDEVASTDRQYTGYTAQLELLSGGQVVSTHTMPVQNGSFSVSVPLSEGVYQYQVRVTGYYLERVSDPVSLTVSAAAEPPVSSVSAPEERVEKVVNLWPFKGGLLTLDLKELFVAEETPQISILSTSFLEGKDYRLEGTLLTQDGFSLSKGSYTIEAVSSTGQTAQVELVVLTRNIGLLTLLGLGIIALLVAAGMGVGLYLALTKRFYGTIQVTSMADGATKTDSRSPARGRCRLSQFDLLQTGFHYGKCYFQATGQRHIFLITDQPVSSGGVISKKVRIESGQQTAVTLPNQDGKMLSILFVSRKAASAASIKAPKAPKVKPPKPPKPPKIRR